MTGGIRGVGAPGRPGSSRGSLIGINVAIYLLELAQGAGINANSGSIYVNGVLVASARTIGGQILPAGLGVGHLIGVAHGDWWRLMTAAFLHYGPIHPRLQHVLPCTGSVRPWRSTSAGRDSLLVYLVSGLAGSAGALVLTPNSATVGASGAIFGILGAALVLERQGFYVLGGSAMGLIVINLALGFFLAGISIGGHIGGLIGGAGVHARPFLASDEATGPTDESARSASPASWQSRRSALPSPTGKFAATPRSRSWRNRVCAVGPRCSPGGRVLSRANSFGY